MIKVSVIVPAYNAEEYIDTCLNSLVSQTLSDMEIIVVNDGSLDNTSAIIKQYQKKYKQILLIDNKKNMGIGKSRNLGLDKASGKYVGFLDSDDYVSKDAYLQYYHFCEKNKLSLVYSNYYKVMGDVIKLFKTDAFAPTSLQEDPSILCKIDLGPCNKLFLKKIIDQYHIRFPENMKYEDVPFTAKNLFHAEKVGHLDMAPYYYRIHGNSETTVMDERVFDIFKGLDIVNDYYKKDRALEEGLEYFNIREVTRYMLRQKYQKEKEIRNAFIEKGFSYLHTSFPFWKQNILYKKESFLKRLIKNHMFLVKLYCFLYQIRRMP